MHPRSAHTNHSPDRNRRRNGPKKQFQHFIPRFILRYFLWVEEEFPNSRRRKPLEHVMAYGLDDGQTQPRNIAKIFGEKNFYTHKDRTRPADAHDVEKKLALLEGKAAKIIADLVRFVSTRSSTFYELSQESVHDLLRFLFVMYYRTASYRFDSIKSAKSDFALWYAQEHNGKMRYTPSDVWTRGLKYYLTTSHDAIIHDALSQKDVGTASENAQATSSDVPESSTTVTNDMDRNVEWYSKIYYGYTEKHNLGIWLAPEGSQFVLTDCGFGSWEGTVHTQPGIHRISVITPQLALVLRLSSSTDADSMVSELLEVPLPVIPSRQKLQRIPITLLTDSQAQVLNNILLSNVPETGHIIFSSRRHMLNILHHYLMTSPSNWADLMALAVELHVWDEGLDDIARVGIHGNANLLDDIRSVAALPWLFQADGDSYEYDPTGSRMISNLCLVFTLLAFAALLALSVLWNSGFL